MPLKKQRSEIHFWLMQWKVMLLPNTGEIDIIALKKRLAEKEKNKRSILFFLKDSVWAKVAAILVIMLAVIYFTNLDHPKFQPQLAKNEDTNVTLPAIIKADSPATYKWSATTGSGTLQTDTNRYLNAQSNTQNATDKVGFAATAGNGTYTITASSTFASTAPSTYNFSASADSSVVAGKEADDGKSIVTAKAEKRQDIFADNNNINFYNGKVVDTKGYPIPGASITYPLKKTRFATDTAGRFSITKLDTVSLATIAAVGYSTTQKKLSSNPDQTIVLSPASTEPGSLEISRKESTRKDANVNDGLLDGKVTGLAITENTPVNGWENFQKYLADSTKVPASANKPVANGTVILSFIIKKDGTPKKIKVDKSLSADCDKEAIRLLTEGPKWNYKNDKRTTVSINF